MCLDNDCESDWPSLKFKIIEIGSWNMDTASTKNINHGIDPQKIRSVSAIIKTDDYSWQVFDLVAKSLENQDRGGISSINSDAKGGITLRRGNFFDNSHFNSGSINRGWITIGYTK